MGHRSALSGSRFTPAIEARLGLVLLAVALALVFVHMVLLGAATGKPSPRLTFHAIPVAISVLYFDWPFDWPFDYTASVNVAWPFQAGENVRATIESVMRAEPDGRVYFWAADDRGQSDFVIAAFALFGPSLPAIAVFHCLLVTAICIFFWVAAGREARVFLLVWLGALFVVLPVYVLAPMSPGLARDAVHISESRLFCLLAVIPAAHLYFAAVDRGRLGLRRIAGCAVQLVLLMMLVHARTSVIWVVVGHLRRAAGARRVPARPRPSP